VVEPFKGTQAQLADEFLRRSQSCQQISTDSDPEYRTGWDIPANVWKLAAARVRTAIITEANPLHDAAPDMLAALEEAAR